LNPTSRDSRARLERLEIDDMLIGPHAVDPQSAQSHKQAAEVGDNDEQASAVPENPRDLGDQPARFCDMLDDIQPQPCARGAPQAHAPWRTLAIGNGKDSYRG